MYLLRSTASLQTVDSAGPFSLGPVSIKAFDYPTYAAFATVELAELFRDHFGLGQSLEIIRVADWVLDANVAAAENRPKHAIYFASMESLSKYFQSPADFDFAASVLPLR